MGTIISKKRLHRSWTMYDWANSAYNLVITSTIFPAYYAAVTTIQDESGVVQDKVNFLGWQISNSALFDYAIAAAYLIIAFLSPILSSIADYRGSKKKFMRFFAYLGALSCVLMFYFTKDTVTMGVILFMIAAIGYCGSLVFYNAYLPEIASPAEQDKLSAQGFAAGYLGSVLLQLICFIFVFKYQEWFGQSEDWGPRVSFLLVGVWWFVFAQIPLKDLPDGKPLHQLRNNENIFSKGFIELQSVWIQLKHMPTLKKFLAAFFFYSMGVQTVMLAAAIFGSKVLRLDTSQLIITILIIQVVAILGAYIMAGFSKRYGNIRVLKVAVVFWIFICVLAYFINSAVQFYFLAFLVGLVMGGIQSISRSTYSKLMPVTRDTTSFFSFYDVTEKMAIVLGMFSFGLIDHISGNMRNSIFVLILFFIIGLIMLIKNKTANRICLEKGK